MWRMNCPTLCLKPLSQDFPLVLKQLRKPTESLRLRLYWTDLLDGPLNQFWKICLLPPEDSRWRARGSRLVNQLKYQEQLVIRARLATKRSLQAKSWARPAQWSICLGQAMVFMQALPTTLFHSVHLFPAKRVLSPVTQPIRL